MNSTFRRSSVESPSDVDIHQLLVPSFPSDISSQFQITTAPSEHSSDASSFVIPDSLSRSNSVFSFSRASFASQIANLTSINIPQAETLAIEVTKLPTSRKAVKAIFQAAEQIQSWIKKALKVLESLDAEDDVEWAAAAGRMGLEDTDKTINKFENLINMYVLSIEELQSRRDIADTRPEHLQKVVEQMEATLTGWADVRKELKKVHGQVELAMEWEELWSKVLADVGQEMDALSAMVFEMEEKRHIAYINPTQIESNQNVDLNELESIIDEPAQKKAGANSRFSISAFESSPLGSPIIENPTDDSNLLALTARMQPLRASLDFLPMRLSMFQTRAENIFPNACRELDDKRARLEKNWEDLSKEAETLRRELSEDRWVFLFRNAGRQAQKMCDSVERSIVKVQEAIHENYQSINPIALGKRIESFEAKKTHYSPAITRVLAIIQKGLKDRLTVNGEILRLHKDLSARMRDLTDTIEDLESLLEPVDARQNAKMRESISSIMSGDRSFASTNFASTPGSSPPSSVDLQPQRMDKPVPKYGMNGYTKQRTPSSSRPPPPAAANRRSSLMPQPKRPTTPMSHSSANLIRRAASPALSGPPSIYRQGSYTPAVKAPPRPEPTPLTNKPRWSAVVKSQDGTLAPSYRTTSTTTPTTARKYTPRSISSSIALPLRSPLCREASASPVSVASSVSKHDAQQYRSFAERVADPLPARTSSLLDPVPYHRNRNASAPVPGTIRSPSSLAVHKEHKSTMSGGSIPRPPSSLNRNYSSQVPLRSMSNNPRPENRLDSSPGKQTNLVEENEYASENEDELPNEPTSSPLSKRTITRPSSVLAMNGKAKRMSLLPIPKGSGRQSSLGSRT
jgi:DNA repair ATPase RecN